MWGNLSYKGKRTKWVVTRAGEVQVARDYYYCEGCRRGFFPQDKRLGIQSGLNRREMAQQMVWLSGLLPYEQCVAVFRRVGG